MKWIGPYGVLPIGREGVIAREGDTLMSYSWPQGAYTYLDCGVLDLGIVRESTLAAARNPDPPFFSELGLVQGIGALWAPGSQFRRRIGLDE